jgi:Cys-tRNA(Pro)/Cys-tRNA(Cys) deacylase
MTDSWNSGDHSAMSVKTNAMRVLDQRQVEYRVHEYSPSPFGRGSGAGDGQAPNVSTRHWSMREAPRAKPLLVMVPGDRELDLRVFAKSTGDKKLRMAIQKEAEPLTGLLVEALARWRY